jgi:glycyl-tRNA synthetase beta chain
MLVEKDLPLSLNRLLALAVRPFVEKFCGGALGPIQSMPPDAGENYLHALNKHFAVANSTGQELASFIYERLAGSLREQGYSAQEVDAVLALRPQRLGDVGKRLAAVRAFAALPEAPALAAANKRVGNILKKTEGAVDARIKPELLLEPAEKALADAIDSVAAQADSAWTNGNYTENLQALAALKAPVDEFFDKVMVNAEDPALRANRLGLLATLHQAMNRVADLSKLAA